MYGLIPLGIVLLILGLNVLFAVIRGFSKSVIRFVTVLLTALVAVAACLIGKSMLPDGVTFVELVNGNMELIRQNLGVDVATKVTTVMEYLKISPHLTETILQLVGALLAPILCVLLFMLVGVVFWLVYLVALMVRKMVIYVRHGKKKKYTRSSAALVGLLQGLVIVAVLFIPISGYLSVAEPAMDVMTRQEILDGNDPAIHTIQVVIAETDDSFTMKAYRLMGGGLLTNSLMSMKVGEIKVSAQDELHSVINLAEGALELASNDVANYGIEEAEIVRLMGQSFTDSKLLTPIVGDVMYAATEAWMNGETFCGMEKPSAGEFGDVVDPTTDVLMEIFNVDAQKADSLRCDVLTITEIGAIVVENGVLSHMGNTSELLTSLDNEAMVTDLVTTLGENPSMKRLIPEVTNLGVRALGHFLNIPQDTQQVYDTFLHDVTDAINACDTSDPQQIKALSEKVGTAFDEAGVFIDDEIMDLYVTGMVHDLVDNNTKGEITEADVQAFFILYAQNLNSTTEEKTEELSTGRPSFDMLTSTTEIDLFVGTVYEGMTEEQKKNTAAAVLAVLCVQIMDMDAEAEDYSEQVVVLVVNTYSDLLGEDHAALEILKEIEVTQPLTTENVQNAASMESLEEMKKTTCVVTMDVLLIDTNAAMDTITSETISVEAGVISAIFSTAGDLAGMLDGSSTELDIQVLAGSVGTILDSLNATGTFGEDKTAQLFTAVMQSKTVRDAAGLDMKTATQMSEQATQGGGNYADTMGAVGGSLAILDKIQRNETIENQEMVDFMKKLNPQSAGMFKVYINASRLNHYGVPEKQSGVSAELLGAIFTYMARDDIENYESEAEALTKLLQMALDAKDSNNEKLYSSEDGTVVGKLPTAKESVSTALDCGAIRYAILDVMTDGEKVTRWDAMQMSGDIKTNTVEYVETIDAVREYRQEHNDQNDLLYEAIIAMFGVQETID